MADREDSAFGPSVSISVSSADFGVDPAAKMERLEGENSQLLREVLMCRKNLDIAHSNVSTLKALSNQLASQLNAANGEVDLLRQRRDAAELRSAREHEQAMADLRSSYENRLAGMRKELEEQIEINMQLGQESQDSHRKADKSFKDIIAVKDELIAELTRTVECLQAGLRTGGGGNGNGAVDRSTSSLSGPNASRNRAAGAGGGNTSRKTTTDYDMASVRNQIIDPTSDLVRLNLKVLKNDVATRQTPLGEVNASFYTSEKKPVTRYFVDVQADKHRLDEVPTVDLRVAGGAGARGVGGKKHYTTPEWPRVWKFQTPQGEVITLSMDIASI